MDATIARHGALPFGWGSSDCVLFPLDCVRAMTGRDLFGLCGVYSSQLEAYRKLKAFGFADVAAAFAAHFEEIPVSFMQRGDLASVSDRGIVCGAICVGGVIAGKGESGLTFVNRAAAQRAFKVE